MFPVLIQKQQKYFSKVLTLPNGVQALVFFEVIERNGRLVARATHAEPIESRPLSQETVCSLPGDIDYINCIPVESFAIPYISPYVKDFSFLKSQPTRAPSL